MIATSTHSYKEPISKKRTKGKKKCEDNEVATTHSHHYSKHAQQVQQQQQQQQQHQQHARASSCRQAHFTYTHLRAIQSPNNDVFSDFLLELMNANQDLVIRCEIFPDATPFETKSYAVSLNGCLFNMQTSSPQGRYNAKEKAKDFVMELAQKTPKNVKDKNDKQICQLDVTTQPWFINAPRAQVESYLMQYSPNTFCIRPSSVPGSYALSYTTHEGVFHTLIEKWGDTPFYFSGDISKETGLVKGLFFTSVVYLVAYWQEMGLEQTWTPVNVSA